MKADSTYVAPTVFEAFNARSLAPEEVAETFIAPATFHSLAGKCHSTVIGPRGSGKTSLLKMLQPRALESWHSPEAGPLRASIDYTGVFVPTDISWSKQTLAIVEGLPPNLVQLFRSAAFTTHVLHEVVEAFLWRTQLPVPPSVKPFRRVSIDAKHERELVSQLAAAWGLNPRTSTLIGLKHSLGARHIEIWSLAQRCALIGVDQELPPWITIEFLSCCSHAVELFDDAVGESGARWAFLFDELELAPEWVMKGLSTALRSTNDKLLFKLAVSPVNERYQDLSSALQAMPDQDYNEIRLWYSYKEEGFEFSRRLFLSVCAARNVSANDVSEILGHSVLDIDQDGSKSYGKGSSQYKVLVRALQHDKHFSDYWRQHNLHLDSLNDLGESEKAAKVRKIYPIVLMRDFFRAPSESRLALQQTRRGRKTLEIYAGAASILTISEGNPRWVIGLTRLLLKEIDISNLPVRKSDQARFIEETVHRFRARLKTISLGAKDGKTKSTTLLWLLDRIGFYFRKCVIVDEFRSQPPLSFTVDAHTPDELVAAIGRGVNSGALVYVPDKGSLGILNDVKGKRFRLSYLLAPHYSMPLRLGASVSLSTILDSEAQQGQTRLL